jgi:uncharacterized protein
MATQATVAARQAATTGVPVDAAERIQVVDILRGFALLGILLVNMQFFKSSPFAAQFADQQVWTSGIDQTATVFIRFFAEGKFYTMFSLLFGFGFAVQMLRAEARGDRFGPRYTRRLLVLLVIGILHGVLLWYGDILKSYALIGFLLLLFRNSASKTLLIWSALCLLSVVVLGTGFLALSMLANTVFPTTQAADPTTKFFSGLAERATYAYSSGSFGEVMQQRLIDNAISIASAIFSVPSILAMFLLGLYAGRRQLFSNVAMHKLLIRRVMIWGLVLGLSLNAAYVAATELSDPAQMSGMNTVALIAQTLGGPALCLGYVAAITLLVQRSSWQQRLAPLAAVGRMALTNYLLQSLICTTIFYSYGLGLFGQVGPAAGVLLSVAIYTLQIALSRWWLRRFRFGPMEWLWRSLTYRRRQPLRT